MKGFDIRNRVSIWRPGLNTWQVWLLELRSSSEFYEVGFLGVFIQTYIAKVSWNHFFIAFTCHQPNVTSWLQVKNSVIFGWRKKRSIFQVMKEKNKTFLTGSSPLTPHIRSVPQNGPVGRSWHSFTPVSSDHIFLFGGFTTERETLSESNAPHQGIKAKKENSKWSWKPVVFLSGDAWLYCVSKNEWKPYKHNHTQRPR